nr:hypothetical protein [Arthrobacter sp. M4]
MTGPFREAADDGRSDRFSRAGGGQFLVDEFGVVEPDVGQGAAVAVAPALAGSYFSRTLRAVREFVGTAGCLAQKRCWSGWSGDLGGVDADEAGWICR